MSKIVISLLAAHIASFGIAMDVRTYICLGQGMGTTLTLFSTPEDDEMEIELGREIIRLKNLQCSDKDGFLEVVSNTKDMGEVSLILGKPSCEGEINNVGVISYPEYVPSTLMIKKGAMNPRFNMRCLVKDFTSIFFL